MNIKDILAKLGVGQSAETKTTPTADELTTLAQSLNLIETAQATKATELTTLEATLSTLKIELTNQATALSQKETDLAAKEQNIEAEVNKRAAKLSGQNAPAPVKPETKELASPEAFSTALQAEKDPAKQIELYRKHKAAAKAAFNK